MNGTPTTHNRLRGSLHRILRYVARTEEGQSFVEFALIVSVMCLLALVPIDLVRYASLRMALNECNCLIAF